LLVIALAGPRRPDLQTRLKTHGLAIVLLLDVSGSMRGPRYEAALAALDALGEALDPDDRWSVVAFNHTTQVIVGWSEPSPQVAAALRRSNPGGGTRLFEAIKDSVRSLEPSPTRKRAIVAITDGNDQSSTAGGSASTDVSSLSGFDSLRDDEGGAVKALRTGEALLYAVGMDWPYEKRGPPAMGYRAARSTSERVDIETLTRLAAPTGGAAFLARTSESLRNTAEQIVAELHQQYTLGYVPPKPADGKIHRISVTTRDPEHKVRARTAYLAKR
jgi:Ca-activated chloride channel family protein